jgi:hypothetical protein
MFHKVYFLKLAEVGLRTVGRRERHARSGDQHDAKTAENPGG